MPNFILEDGRRIIYEWKDGVLFVYEVKPVSITREIFQHISEIDNQRPSEKQEA